MNNVGLHDAATRPRWIVSGDFDGLFALFFSGLPDLLLLAGLGAVCGLPEQLMVTRILPGVALSILLGNVFYSWQAYRLAAKTGRSDVTAVPFGINAPTIFAYIFLVMAPVYRATHDPALAWHVGVFACLLSGIIQTAGSFCTDWLRRSTPRAALLCPLAGIALTYLCLDFIFQIFQSPAIGVIPMVLLFTLYASRLRLPFRIPVPAFALAVGAIITLSIHHFHLGIPANHTPAPRIYLPHPVNLLALLRSRQGWQYLSIIFPMGLLDTIVSLQILESVKIAGDDYPTRPSLLVNGLATLIAAFFGSPFPTILYFGHMSHKRAGARIGYSAMSGVLTTLLCITGLLPLLLYVVPLEVAAAVVIWFGLMMIGQAFSEVSADDAIAVALGLIPLIAQWLSDVIVTTVRAAGSNLESIAGRFGSDLAIYGVLTLSQGALLTSMVWVASLAYAFRREFFRAAAWFAAGAALSCVGLIHAYAWDGQGVRADLRLGGAPTFTLLYLVAAACMLMFALYAKHGVRLAADPLE